MDVWSERHFTLQQPPLVSTGAPFRLEGEWSRIYVRTSAPEALVVLPRVFGARGNLRKDPLRQIPLDR